MALLCFNTVAHVRICKSAYSAKAHIDFIIKKHTKKWGSRILKLSQIIFIIVWKLLKRETKIRVQMKKKLMTQTVIEF